ncbi:MAG TPA: DUF433 domain-containing protein [Casimicrobiaceae bacterium]|nr:DUF433 domain-containing protein [Casimicrobiaceae bacterium]
MIDWSTCSAVERGWSRERRWVFRGTRVAVSALFENLEDGAAVSDFVEWCPGVSTEPFPAVLQHAAHSTVATRRSAKGSKCSLQRILAPISAEPRKASLRRCLFALDDWPRISRAVESVVAAISASSPGSYREVEIASRLTPRSGPAGAWLPFVSVVAAVNASVRAQ